MSRPRLIALLLALVTLVVYLPVTGHDFLCYDDDHYVTNNLVVQQGLTWGGLKWAFTTFQAANWHPLTWLSHMADCELFQLNAGAHHLVNVLFHAANTALLFALLWRMTGLIQPAAFVAALFAWHPLHVESVAWVAERKDVLSTFFALLTLLAYARYAGKRTTEAGVRTAGGQSSSSSHLSSSLFYFLALFFFAMGLLAKPMLVTLPLLMLLLNYWPLQRSSPGTFPWPLVREQFPFFALSAGSCVITLFAQSAGHAIASLETVPLSARLVNAVVCVARYLLELFWPAGLAVYYPRTPNSAAALAGSAAALLIISAAAWRARHYSRCWLAGWGWFLAALIPVIGLVQVGNAAMADRYTYLPSIGIFTALIFGLYEYCGRVAGRRDSLAMNRSLASVAQVSKPAASLSSKSAGRGSAGGVGLAEGTRVRKPGTGSPAGREQTWKSAPRNQALSLILTAGLSLTLVACIILTEKQLSYWRNTETLFRHALAVTKDNDVAHDCLGLTFEQQGRFAEALAEYREAVRLNPAHYQLRLAIGELLEKLGRPAEALEEFRWCLGRRPEVPALHAAAARALAAQGDLTDALPEFAEAERLDPHYAEPHLDLAKFYLAQGRDRQAVEELQAAARAEPRDIHTLIAVARYLAANTNDSARDGQGALLLALKANDLAGNRQPEVFDVLGMAFAATGDFSNAVVCAQNALEFAPAAKLNQRDLMRQRLELYENRQPWRESFRATNATNTTHGPQ